MEGVDRYGESVSTGEPAGRRAAKESLRVLAGPILSYLDKRFQETYDRIDERMNELYSRVATEVETMSEMTIVMQRFLDVAGARMEEAMAGIAEARRAGPSPVELAFAMAAVGRLGSGARILHVGSDRGLHSTLHALGYEVSTLGGLDGDRFDVALWLSTSLDRHTVELLAKSLDQGGELVLSLREPADFVDESLWDWTVVERRRVDDAESGRELELVRLTPRT